MEISQDKYNSYMNLYKEDHFTKEQALKIKKISPFIENECSRNSKGQILDIYCYNLDLVIRKREDEWFLCMGGNYPYKYYKFGFEELLSFLAI